MPSGSDDGMKDSQGLWLDSCVQARLRQVLRECQIGSDVVRMSLLTAL